MRLLALDTSSVACSVALAWENKVYARHEVQPREHTRLLMPMIRSVLAESATTLADLDAIVLGNGPGSFIGMRIAASVAQGLAHGSGLGIVPVSSLAAVAAEVLAESPGSLVAVTQDAHMSEVYLGLFASDADGLPVAVSEERIHGQGPIAELAQRPNIKWTPAGAGWQRYPQLLESNRGRLTTSSAALYPQAKQLLAIGAAGLRSGGVQSPASLEPAYLRQKVAEAPAPSS